MHFYMKSSTLNLILQPMKLLKQWCSMITFLDLEDDLVL